MAISVSVSMQALPVSKAKLRLESLRCVFCVIPGDVNTMASSENQHTAVPMDVVDLQGNGQTVYASGTLPLGQALEQFPPRDVPVHLKPNTTPVPDILSTPVPVPIHIL